MRLSGYLILLIGLAVFYRTESSNSADDDLDVEDFSELEDVLDEDATGPGMDDVPTPKPSAAPKVATIPYKTPSTKMLTFYDFLDGTFDQWTKSENEKFSGEWSNALRTKEAIKDDKGLRVMQAAKHHAISRSLKSAEHMDNKGKELVFAYEALFEDGLNCGGAYMKLFDKKSISDLSKFDNETPYVLMFGPDRCGSTDKVEEHHLVDPPSVPTKPGTHHYMFRVTPDNKYQVYIDSQIVREGSMTTDFTPPFTSPAEIDDPEDEPPADWLPKIPDPNAVKPDDWDESAPVTIPDPEAVKPDNWLENEEKLLPNPDAVKPSSWDDEEDGEWVAPMISNPNCAGAAGCGKWSPPQIHNPNYRGPFKAPLIDNPKGPYVRRKIANPDHFVNEAPHAISGFDAVGIELWTMQAGILFDNILISRSLPPVLAVIEETWKPRVAVEDAMLRAVNTKVNTETAELRFADKIKQSVALIAMTHPILFGGGVVSFFMATILFLIKLLRRTKTKASVTTPKEGEREKTSSPSDAAEGSATTSAEELREKEPSPVTRKRVGAKKD